ncbi:hypothetical protein [Mycobacterium lacus]|uniref:Uncharacterized protein n=1 Tax=Mycobacterium lacus TaxID=169765 RepID=A0A1X1YTQ9_9MYCO|nr:hypothetical protein [Mycobacterium lacus]ORW14475.1 hypothetical protein AWC15_13385 [Mycobacterium lacus]BBX95396.1 hypothetical protein MLAC_06900 [Mycobacterium lacus]
MHIRYNGADQAHSESPETDQQTQPARRAPHCRDAQLIDENRAYFIGTDERGMRYEIILVADDREADLWIAIHARPTPYQKNW